MLKRHLYIGLFVCTLMCLNVFPSLAFAAPYDGQNPTLATEESTGNDQTIVDATGDAAGDTVVDTTLPSTGKDDLSDDPGKNAETTDPSEVTSVTEPDSDDAATPTVPTQESAADSTETGNNSAADGSDDSIKPVDTDKEANILSPVVDEKTKEDSTAGSVSAITPASEPEAAVAPLSQSKTSALLNGWVTNSSGTYFYDQGALHYGWLVRSDYKSYGLQRYFMDKATGSMRVSSLITASEAGWWAYATRYGYVVRGRYTAPNGTVYFANNDGKLENPGWMVSSAYGQGLQRYYIDKNAHGAVPGYSSAGWNHYTTPSGYVVRGRYKASNGTVYFANNDGKLANPGWMVSSAYGQGLQRYYIDKNAHGAVPGYSEDGWAHYTLSAGYVLRGITTQGADTYLADNDGRIAKSGWYVMDVKDGKGLQRYWVSNHRVVKDRLIKASEAGWWAYATRYGYVVRGRYKASNGTVYFANNDGKLANPGWMVSSAYGQGLQRYYIDKNAHGAVPGYSEDGWAHYTLSAGYVLRGITTQGGATYLADNDGRIAKSGWYVMDVKDGKGLQRYWVNNHRVVKDRLITASEAGWWAYATRYGYVVRGVYDTGRGLVYLANNDGKLASANGWLVTGAYSGGVLQRYYFDATAHAARSGFFTVAGYGDCFGLGGVGYVLRGKVSWNNHVLLANNDGKLNTTKGWLVTGAYDGGTLQRYWMENCYSNHFKGARVSYFTVNGQTYYGLSGKGYVLRNGYLSKNYVLYKANNNGALSQYRATDKMRILLQNPELPAGCESVALTMVLRSLGFGLNKTTIADSYMPYSSWDFTHSFQGSPYSGGGILAPGLITTANNYLRSQGSSLSCKSLSNSSFSKLVSIANNGTPVLVWTTMYMGSPQYSGNYVGGYQWYYNEHCVVLCGSGNGGVRIFDSLSGEVWRDYGDFSRLYSSCGSMAAVIA